jgi:formylglycine-generating enzyme required for sulfatase activity
MNANTRLFMFRWVFLMMWALATVALVPIIARVILTTVPDETIQGPRTVAERDSWLNGINDLRATYKWHVARESPKLYGQPRLTWISNNFVQTQMMVEDRYFYDPSSRKYTVDRYLDDLRKRYGGIDSVLLWSGYPNIGIDSRNQRDFLADLPGGIEGLKSVVKQFHERGVKVLLPVYPWDIGTDDSSVSRRNEFVKLAKELGVDGVNGDTMRGFSRSFAKDSEQQEHILAFEPEMPMGEEDMLCWNTMSWGYWPHEKHPSVCRYKWFEPQHMTHICERWAKDRSDTLQDAYINGIGYVSWENVWGIWNQLVDRDAEMLRRMAIVEHGLADVLHGDWEPYFPTLQPDVYCSKFSNKRCTAWLLVNRSDAPKTGAQLRIPAQSGKRYFDLWHGKEIVPKNNGTDSELSVDIARHEAGAIVAVDTPDADLQQLLQRMASLTEKPVTAYSAEWKPSSQVLIAGDAQPIAASKAPPGMVLIPRGPFHFKVHGVEIEGENAGVDVQYSFEPYPQRTHDAVIDVKPFFIDRYNVTNAEFKRFLDATHYKPADDHNFLRDWKNGIYPTGWDKKPVTWVSLEDACAYAEWAKKRLPHEWEWQYAAQGSDQRAYPWGNAVKPNTVPTEDHSRRPRIATDVDSYPAGASPFGVQDLIGNVWQWTDEYEDNHTRFAILRGGSFYRPDGSVWYFPMNTQLSEHGKFLLMSPGRDRSAMIGFRCAVSAKQ